jgi:hypothetical protein
MQKNLNYLEIAPDNHSEVFCARILLNSQLDLHEYKRNQEFLKWIKKESITLDRNPLETTLCPQQVGFLTHIVTRIDQTTMYETRARTTTDNCPPFFLQVKYLKSGHATTKVWNVYTDKTDTDSFTRSLKNAFNNTELRQFFLW